MNWREVCQDRSLADLPYKIELDKHGKIIMSPAHKRHSRLQARILRLPMQQLPQGDAMPECAVETSEGTKVPDVAWISDERWQSLNPDDASCVVAPEICVEILSPTNTIEEMLGTPERSGKRELYFQAGAGEFWLCDESGAMSFYGRSGPMQKSVLCPESPNKV